jgi:hypothetical protein
VKVTDEQIRDLIDSYNYAKGDRPRLLMTRERCFYEDCWTETILDKDATFKMMKELLEMNNKE